MAGKPTKYYLKKLEEYRTREDKLKVEMADELGIVKVKLKKLSKS